MFINLTTEKCSVFFQPPSRPLHATNPYHIHTLSFPLKKKNFQSTPPFNLPFTLLKIQKNLFYKVFNIFIPLPSGSIPLSESIQLYSAYHLGNSPLHPTSPIYETFKFTHSYTSHTFLLNSIHYPNSLS